MKVKRAQPLMTADDIRKKVNDALREFGRYQFGDKGAREVMDLEPIVEHLKTLPAEEARDLLVAVAATKKNGQYCNQLVGELVIELQDQPEEWWATLMTAPELEEMYG